MPHKYSFLLFILGEVGKKERREEGVKERKKNEKTVVSREIERIGWKETDMGRKKKQKRSK